MPATASPDRLTTELLLDAAMDRARGRHVGPAGEAHARLSASARSFALAAEPKPGLYGIAAGVFAVSRAEGVRVVVSLSRGDAAVVLSGPPGASAAWGVDSIDATEPDAMALMADALAAWPPRP